jgi:hypothetical protein
LRNAEKNSKRNIRKKEQQPKHESPRVKREPSVEFTFKIEKDDEQEQSLNVLSESEEAMKRKVKNFVQKQFCSFLNLVFLVSDHYTVKRASEGRNAK